MEHAWGRRGGGMEEPQTARKVQKMAQPCSLYLMIGVWWGDPYVIAMYQTWFEMFCNHSSIVITKLELLQRNYGGALFGQFFHNSFHLKSCMLTTQAC